MTVNETLIMNLNFLKKENDRRKKELEKISEINIFEEVLINSKKMIDKYTTIK